MKWQKQQEEELEVEVRGGQRNRPRRQWRRDYLMSLIKAASMMESDRSVEREKSGKEGGGEKTRKRRNGGGSAKRAKCDLVWGPQARLEVGSLKSITICGGSIILLIYL